MQQITMFHRIIFALPAARVGGAALLCALLFTWGSLYAQAPAQVIEGRVTNGTTNRPVAKAQVRYVMMARGPEPLATQVTDSQGKFRFEMPPADSPVLLRVEYQGTTYSLPIIPQQASQGLKDIQVFEAAHDRHMIAVKEQAIFLHPSGKNLVVLEQIVVENRSQPAKTYVNPEGTFPFTLAGSPQQPIQVSVEGPGGMPINQSPIPKDTENAFAIAYPIRPGETQIRVEYSLDYHSPFQFSKLLDLPPERVDIVTPGSQVQVAGDGLTPLGADPSTGFTGYRVAPKGNLVRLEISGDVPPKAAAEQAPGGEGEGESASLVSIPDPVSERRWIIVSAAGLVMLAGLVYHLRHE